MMQERALETKWLQTCPEGKCNNSSQSNNNGKCSTNEIIIRSNTDWYIHQQPKIKLTFDIGRWSDKKEIGNPILMPFFTDTKLICTSDIDGVL